MYKPNSYTCTSCTIEYPVKLTCMIKKCGLFTFKETDLKRSSTREGTALLPLIKNLLRPPTTICLETVISSNDSYPRGL